LQPTAEARGCPPKPSIPDAARAGGIPIAAGTMVARHARRRRNVMAEQQDEAQPAHAGESDPAAPERADGLPALPTDPTWMIEIDGADPVAEHTHDSWLAMVDGVIGSLGSPLVHYVHARREVMVAGVWTDAGPDADLLRLPDWTHLDGELQPERSMRRVLDLRSGIVHHVATGSRGPFRAVTFASRPLPGVAALRAVGAGVADEQHAPLALHDRPHVRHPLGPDGLRHDHRVTGERGGVAVAAAQWPTSGDGTRFDRLAAYRMGRRRAPGPQAAARLLARAERLGFDGLLARQRRWWEARWHEMGIRVEGDEDLQRAIRFTLFHLDASIAVGQREAPLGPRGLSGPSYKGHVFWDSEVFMLPFFAATRPAAARAMLEYRVRRLGAAQRAARDAGLRGAWFPWESAADGRDVTPPWIAGPDAHPIRVWTGERELHVVADIAWAAHAYIAWSGDRSFAAGEGRRLLVETARFWASRVDRDPNGSVHLRGVMGPDEYHEFVDDNAYTNIMARWNLRAAAEAVSLPPGAASGAGTGLAGAEARGDVAGDLAGRFAAWGSLEPADEGEVADWLGLADRLVDGYDARTRVHEQFAGFHDLEDVRIADLAPRPAWGDVLLGRERAANAQVVKQADVLLLHHLIPDLMPAGSLEADLDFYEPRTAHGSSLSPATHAALLARVGAWDGALDALGMAAYMDLDDRNGTAREGLHLATMGGVWQAMAMGFGGLRPAGDALAVDPRLPPHWERLEVPVRFHGRAVRLIATRDRAIVRAQGPVPIVVPGAGRMVVDRDGLELEHDEEGWRVRRPQRGAGARSSARSETTREAPADSSSSR
jgi:trehalose/maltose hydrolase-like predicted phosphorylase